MPLLNVESTEPGVDETTTDDKSGFDVPANGEKGLEIPFSAGAAGMFSSSSILLSGGRYELSGGKYPTLVSLSLPSALIGSEGSIFDPSAGGT